MVASHTSDKVILAMVTEQPAPNLDALTHDDEATQEQKRFTTAQAQAARMGHELRKVPSGYVLSRWSHSKHVGDLDTIEILLRRMGATI